METLQEHSQNNLNINESLEGELQSLAKKLSDRVNENNMIIFDKYIPLGENDACIDGIDNTGVYLHLDILDHTDNVQIKYFSDEVLKEVIKEMKKMAKFHSNILKKLSKYIENKY